MSRQDVLEAKLLLEIDQVINPKLFNISLGTATKLEKDIVKECFGFRSLVLYSVMSIGDIKKIWEDSGLKFR
jgi:hypothetical protein